MEKIDIEKVVLDPCPWCGKRPLLHRPRFDGLLYEGQISCIDKYRENEHIVGQRCLMMPNIIRYRETEEEVLKTVIEAWNKKPDPWRDDDPTEEDLKDIDEDNEYCFAVCFEYDGPWLSDFLFKANMEKRCFESATSHDGTPIVRPFGTVQWQKVRI